MYVNAQKVVKELAVLRSVVVDLQELVEGRKPPTYYPNPNNPDVIAFSVGRAPLDKIASFLGNLSVKLGEIQLGEVLDAVVLKPMPLRSARDARQIGLCKTLFLNFDFTAWTREEIVRHTLAKSPNDKFHDVAGLMGILDKMEGDIELHKFEHETCIDTCEEDSRGSRSGREYRPVVPRTALISAEEAEAIMVGCGLGDSADTLIPALLGFMPKNKKRGNA